MIRRIAWLNEKGGSGKSTSALNLSANLASRFGQRVLLIDVDHQANITAVLTQGDFGKSTAMTERQKNGQVDPRIRRRPGLAVANVRSTAVGAFPDWLRTSRTTQWQLANLVQLGYLATTPVRSTSPNFPFVYFATGRGVKLVNRTYAAHGLDIQHPVGEGRKATGVAIDSILHELLLTEFELAVKRTVETRLDLTLLATERRYYRRERQLRFAQSGRTSRVIPDAGFLLRVGNLSPGTSQNHSFATLLNFVELDNGTMPPAKVLHKLQQYAVWAESESGQRHLQLSYSGQQAPMPQSGFRLLLVVHDKQRPDGDPRRLAALFQQALELPSAMRDRIWFATAADLKARQHHSPPLADAIWYRGRDAKSWLRDYQRLPEQNANGPRRRFVAGQLATLPRHPLFPREQPPAFPLLRQAA